MVKKAVSVVLAVTVLLSLLAVGASFAAERKDLTFVFVPKVVHEWFDAVNVGAQMEGKALSETLGVKVTVDFRSPSAPEITLQNTILEQAAATNPDGIAIDPIDYNASKQIIDEIRARGIPVILFDAQVPESGLAAVGNDFAEQAIIEVDKMAELLNYKGKVAIMHGVPSAANHAERYDAMQARFKEKYPDIQIIDGGASQDQVEVSQQQAAAVIAANPDLDGYLCVCGAAPIGISAAINEAGKKGKIIFVGAENLLRILHYIKDGTIIYSASTKPQGQGALAVLMLFQAYMGMDLPKFVDTGILTIDSNNVDEWIELVSAGGRESSVK